MKSHETKYDLIDVIIRETVEYQVQKIPNSFFEDNTTDSNAGDNKHIGAKLMR